MVALRYGDSDVELDLCTTCRGIWLDDGEFRNIVSALEEQTSKMPAAELLGAAVREAREALTGDGEWRHAGQILRLLELRLLVDHPTLRRLVLALEKGTPFG
jgi:Zn-finger nucleic acid-binding protein